MRSSLMRLSLLLALLCGLAVPAFAGSGTITVLDSGGTTRTYDITTDGSGHYLSNGTLWDYSAGANGLGINASHQASTTDAANGTVAAGTAAGVSELGGCVYNTSTPAPTNGQQVALQCGPNGNLATTPRASPIGGAIPFTLNSAASTNATNVDASPGTLYHISVQNKAAAEEFLIFFNSATTPTCTGTAVYTIQVPSVTSTGNAVGGVVEDFSVGLAFSAGIGICATTAIGGTGSVAANDLTINLTYK